jgi:shikimate dehydrogenase
MNLLEKRQHTDVQLAVIGDPISHSLSPLIHNSALAAAGLDLSYGALRIRANELGAFTTMLRKKSMMGVNVTIPLKETIIPFLDDLSPVADALQAVNTVVVNRQGPARLIGDNTDVYGFIQPLLARKSELKDATCVVWGAGGAARAVVYALCSRFAVGYIHLISRRAEQAKQLIEDLGLSDDQVHALDWSDKTAVGNAERSATLLVNTTPLGTKTAPDVSPCASPEALRPGQIVYDLVYNPVETNLLRAARMHGADAINGLEMLIGQASQSFRLWTGTDMPQDGVRRALAAHLLKDR